MIQLLLCNVHATPNQTQIYFKLYFFPSISARVIVSVIIVAATLHSLHVDISSLYEVPKENEHGLKERSKNLENKIVDLCFSQRI